MHVLESNFAIVQLAIMVSAVLCVLYWLDKQPPQG